MRASRGDPPRRIHPWLLVAALSVLGVALGTQRAAAEGGSGPALTALEAGPLGRADLVVVGTLEEVQALRDMALARVRAERVLKGDGGDEPVVTVLVRGPRPTADPKAPSAPYLAEGMTGRFVFFLVAGSGGVGYWLDALFDADGDVGPEKVAALEQHVRLGQVPDPDARARQTLEWLLDAGAAGGTWTRVHAARELNHLAGVRPDLFDGPVRDRIRRIASRGALPAQRDRLLEVLRRFGTEAPPEDEAASALPQDAGLADALARATSPSERVAALEDHLRRGGEAALGAVFARLPAEAPAVRAAFLDRLAEGGWEGALVRVRALYAFEPEPDVLAAIVRAAGRLGGAQDVPWVEARVANPLVEREALFALARIGTPEAVEALERARERARQGGLCAPDAAALVAYLLSPAFREVEAAEGRSVPR